MQRRAIRFKRWPVWWSILSDAGRAAVGDVKIAKMPGLMVFSIVVAIYLFLVWKTGGPVQAGDEFRDRILWSLAPLLALPLCFLVRLLFIIPDREIELGSRVESLRKRLTPRYQVGSVTRVFSADKLADRAFVCLTVKNISDAQSDICSAHIVELRSSKGGEIIDPIELGWTDNSGEQPWAAIPSGATRTVKVFWRDGDGLKFNMASVAAAYDAILDGAETVIGKIKLEDRYWGGQDIHFVAYSGHDARIEIIQTEAYQVKSQRDPEQENDL